MTTNGTDLLTCDGTALEYDHNQRMNSLNTETEFYGAEPWRKAREEQRDAIVAAVRAQARSCSVCGPLLHHSPVCSAAPQAPSLLEAQREAASKAWDAAWDAVYPHTGPFHLRDTARDRYLAETYPLPAPAGITLSDGATVTYAPQNNRLTRHNTDGFHAECIRDQWQSLLNRPTDTGNDFEKVKAYAAEQSEAR